MEVDETTPAQEHHVEAPAEVNAAQANADMDTTLEDDNIVFEVNWDGESSTSVGLR
jgi:hypothetical protein